MTRDSKFRPAESFALAGTRVVFALVVAVTLTGAATLSRAQTVPVPKPAPKGRDNTQMSASEGQKRGPFTTGTTAITPPEPVIPDPHRNIPSNIFASFDANQKAQAAKVSNYLSSLQTLVGNFVQVGPDGTKTKGDFYI